MFATLISAAISVALYFTLERFYWRKQELLDLYDQNNIFYQIVAYEKLISNPREELGSVFSFMGIPWHDDVLNHDQLHSGLSIGNTNNSRPIDSTNQGKWKQSLFIKSLETLDSICAPLANKYGYNQEGS